MKKIKILGEEIAVHFNMATIIAYEEIMGEPLFNQKFDTQKSRYALLFAAITTSQPDSAITADRLLKEVGWQEANDAIAVVMEAMTEWFAVPAVAQEAEDEQAEKKGRSRKN